MAPPKVKVFSWQLCLDRLPTRDNLLIRKVISFNDSLHRAFCNLQAESSGHLFLSCACISALWSSIFSWLGVDCSQPASISLLAFIFGEGISSKKNVAVCMMLWHAILWCIWELAIIFENVPFDFSYSLERIKVCSWKWLLSSDNSLMCSFSDWCMAPLCRFTT